MRACTVLFTYTLQNMYEYIQSRKLRWWVTIFFAIINDDKSIQMIKMKRSANWTLEEKINYRLVQ